MVINIPILMYHQVSNISYPKFYEYTVTTKAFEAQMRVLKCLGFTTINFNQLWEHRNGRADLPRKPVIITFDDVLADAIGNAIPLLEASGFTAVFYVPTNFVGIKSSWMLPDVNIDFQIVDWSTLENIHSKGFEIGSHTMNHPLLDRISENECRMELEGSRKTLEDTLGHEIRHLAYPFGAHNEIVKELAYKAGYHTACTTEPYISQTDDDFLALPRLNMGMGDSLMDFIIKLHTAKTPIRDMENYLWILRSKLPKPIGQFVRKYLPKKNPN